MRQGKGIAARTYDDREETSSEEEEPVYEHEGARIREKKGAALSFAAKYELDKLSRVYQQEGIAKKHGESRSRAASTRGRDDDIVDEKMVEVFVLPRILAKNAKGKTVLQELTDEGDAVQDLKVRPKHLQICNFTSNDSDEEIIVVKDSSTTQETADRDDVDLIKLIGRGSFGRFEVGADHEKEGKILTYVIRLVIRTINLEILQTFKSPERLSFLRLSTKKDKVNIATGVCSGLMYLHDKNVIHFDVKPNNILVELPSMASKLCDMGVSTLLKTGRTTLRGPRGTQEFMSPEMFAFNAHITKATDVWSFGVVLIELFGRQQVWQLARSTVFDAMRRKEKNSHVPDQRRYLSNKEENEFVQFLLNCASLGYPRTRKQVITLASEIVSRKSAAEITVGLGWWQRFRERHPQIALRQAEPLAQVRLNATKREVVDAYYLNLHRILEEENLFEKPGQIFNCDETGVPLNPRTGRVIVERGCSHPYVATSGDKTQLTVLACVSATGYVLPPTVVLDRKKINSEIFEEWLTDHFLVHAPRSRPLFLLLDGHSSHFTLPVNKRAVEEEVVVFCLLPHTTHLLQPLDRGCFGCLKVYWSEECQKFTTERFGMLVNRKPHVAQVPRRFHSPLVTKRVPFSLRIITLPQLPPPPETRKIPTAKVVTTAENIEKLEEKQRKKKEAEEEKEKRRIEREAKAREKAEKKRLAAEKKLQRAAAAAEKRLREADDAQARPERPRRERRKKLMTTSSTISTNFEFCCH
ncbi:uncharacterized protein [Oscarella lobularis]|uniref:uncharacterized protein n=1 Tax=Oscarella lobularis TaxID=121494 RepID=UPI003313C51C